MKVVTDTNVLLRDVLHDDRRQARVAAEVLRRADLVAIPVSVFCEFAWVLRQGYKKSTTEVGEAIRFLIDSENVVTDRATVEAGLEILDQGGDFADGAIAYEGQWRGAEEFVSFDKWAVSLLKARGRKARLLS